MKKILYVASEAVPFIKTGGLADVVGSLPKNFNKEEFDVRVILPKYACIKQEWADKLEYVTNFSMDYNWKSRYVGIFKYELDGITYYFIDNEELYTLQYRLLLAQKEAEELQKMIQNALESGRPLGTIKGDVSGESIQAAQTIITTVPIVLTYPFFQRYFVSGVTMGSVKE